MARGKDTPMSLEMRRQLTIQGNRDEMVRNVTHFSKTVSNKELVLDLEEIREQMDQFIFRVPLVAPDVRIQRLDEAFDDFDRPQALRDAMRIAEEEKELYRKMKETDPDLLSEGSKVLDVDRVRQVYYSILQDQYSKGCYTKLKKINSAIYPRTP